ncbi:MAG: HEAT repeat domain-containing protein [Thermoguttaceae bacterium]
MADRNASGPTGQGRFRGFALPALESVSYTSGMKPIITWAVGLLVFVGTAGVARSDVFVLRNGGRVTGELVNRNETPRKKYVIRIADGAEVTIEANQVQKVLRPRPDELEYERIAPTYPDTVASQWELAVWCKEHKLTAQRETHLRRIIELDPDHAAARRALGYNRVDGQWVTQDELMRKRGLVKYKGQWKYPQEVEVAENKRKTDAAQQEWCQKVKRWRGWLATDRRSQAEENLRGITDPVATKALTIGLRDDRDPHVRLLLVEALTRIDTTETALALAIASISDEVEEVRTTCLDNLQTKKRPEVVSYFVGKLKDKDNAVVNLAAIGLGRMKDPSSIRSLIDSLVTKHKFRVPNPAGEGGTNAAFGSGGGSRGGGMTVGGGPKYIYKEMTNQAVLDALVAITGRNFNFDKQAWKYWYHSQEKPPDRIDARRG